MILLNQLNDRFEPLPSVSEQLNLLDSKEEKSVSDLEFTQEFIDRYLQERHRETKYAIYETFSKSLSSEDNINFLKNLYGIGGQTDTVKGSGIGETHDYKGIKFNRGYFDDSAKEQLFKWNYIEKRIKELIREDRYLNSKELEEYPNWLEEQEQQRELIEKGEELATQFDSNNSDNEVEEQFEYQYHLGDKVYIGVDEYEILEFNEDFVRLYDYQYPLFNQEFSREEFDRKVQENPSNDHLKVKVEKIQEPQEEVEEEPEIVANNEEPTTIEKNKNDNLLGVEFEWENRKYRIDKVSDNEFDLRDITFQSTAGLPIFRVEKIEKILPILAEKEKKEFTPEFERTKKSRVDTFDIHPEISNADRSQFRITNDDLGVGSPREKFNRNVAAIKVLKQCENENRFATPEEQEILSQYVGWGGLPQAFDDKDSSWSRVIYYAKIFTIWRTC